MDEDEMFKACESVAGFIATMEFREVHGAYVIEAFVRSIENGETAAMSAALAKNIFNDKDGSL